MGLWPLAGQPIELQPFELTQLAWAGMWDRGLLLDANDASGYAAILIFYVAGYPPSGSGGPVSAKELIIPMSPLRRSHAATEGPSSTDRVDELDVPARPHSRALCRALLGRRDIRR
jgi:hypothetical protein